MNEVLWSDYYGAALFGDEGGVVRAGPSHLPLSFTSS
jgi:hypothetical protein